HACLLPSTPSLHLISSLFPYTTLFRSLAFNFYDVIVMALDEEVLKDQIEKARKRIQLDRDVSTQRRLNFEMSVRNLMQSFEDREDRKSTRLNSSHRTISYAVFCLKKKS